MSLPQQVIISHYIIHVIDVVAAEECTCDCHFANPDKHDEGEECCQRCPRCNKQIKIMKAASHIEACLNVQAAERKGKIFQHGKIQYKPGPAQL